MEIMNIQHYKFIGAARKVLPTDDLVGWFDWYAIPDNRQLFEATIPFAGRDLTISTIFLGFIHAAKRPVSIPKLFETRIFGLADDCYIRRDLTFDEAEKSFKQAEAMVYRVAGRALSLAEKVLLKAAVDESVAKALAGSTSDDPDTRESLKAEEVAVTRILSESDL